MNAAARTGIGVALMVAAMVWSGQRPTNEDLLFLASAYSLAALGVYVPFILGGALSLAYVAYLSIGGYSVAVLAAETGLPVLSAVPIGMAIAAAVAVALGVLTSRLTGYHLAMVSLLFSAAFVGWITNSGPTLGGTAGKSVSRPAYLLGMELDRDRMVLVSVVVVALVVLLVRRLQSSPFGVAVQGMRTAPDATAAVGYSLTVVRVAALAIGAAIAAIGGSLFTLTNGSISPGTFSTHVVFLAVFMPLLGGSRTPLGAVLGAALVVYFTFRLPVLEGAGDLVFTLAVLAVVILMPRGLLGAGEQLLGGATRLVTNGGRR